MITLITGASSGIGKELAEGFARRGFNLILVARREEKLQEIRKELTEKYGVKIRVICCDVSVKEECLKLYETVKPVKPDVVINNAGFGLFGKFDETNLDTELQMIDTNIKGVHIITKLFLRDFKERNYGFILNVASIAGFMAGPLMATYYATKNYVLQLTKAIYEELKHDKCNVYIGALCPGPVDTEFNAVAGAEFAVPGITAREAAECAIEGMFDGELIIIPQKLMKLTAAAVKLSPTKLSMNAAYYIAKSREAAEKRD